MSVAYVTTSVQARFLAFLRLGATHFRPMRLPGAEPVMRIVTVPGLSMMYLKIVPLAAAADFATA